MKVKEFCKLVEGKTEAQKTDMLALQFKIEAQDRMMARADMFGRISGRVYNAIVQELRTWTEVAAKHANIRIDYRMTQAVLKDMRALMDKEPCVR